VSTQLATVLAALIGSSPAWATVDLANRRAMRQQTRQITEHVTTQLDQRLGPQPDGVVTGVGERQSEPDR
jgi:hypothetical protein